jgi:HEXXH motif-containing protein
MQLAHVLRQLTEVDPEAGSIRQVWISRQQGAVREALDRLAEIATRDRSAAEVVRGVLESASPARAGLALSSPCCLWGLRQDDWKVARRELAISAADAVGHAPEQLLPVLERAIDLDDRRLLPISGLSLSRAVEPPIGPHPSIRICRGVAIAAGDSLLQSTLVDDHPHLEDPQGFGAFCDTLEIAIDQVETASPGFAGAIRGLLRIVVPMQRAPAGVPSSSSNSVPGAIWITEDAEPSIIAEQLVHECTHALLFLCQESDPLLDPTSHGDGWDGPRVYSPWRDDPRPLAGLLHGAVVFTRVAMFHVARAEACDISRRRTAALLPQLEIANELLAEAHLTEAGEALREALRERLAGLLSAARPLCATSPCYVECSSLPRLEGDAWARQAAHRAGARHRAAASAGTLR